MTSVSPSDLQTKYPPGQYLVAVGTSPVSLDEARAKAKAAIASQIRSQIKSSAQTVMEKVVVGTTASVTGRSIQSVVENADFSHAETIRIDEQTTGAARAGWQAVAFLHAGAILPVLIQEYEQAAVQFRVAARNAMGDQPPTGFATLYHACRDHMRQMARKALEIQAISRTPYVVFDQDSAWWRSVLAKRTDVVSRFQACVQLRSDLDSSHNARLVSLVTGVLGQMGIATTAGGGCRGGTVLRVDCAMNCKQGHLGPMCQLDMNGVLINAGTGEKLAEIPFGDAFKGAHGNDPEKAKKKACDAVTQDKVRAALERAFATVLAVD